MGRAWRRGVGVGRLAAPGWWGSWRHCEECVGLVLVVFFLLLGLRASPVIVHALCPVLPWRVCLECRAPWYGGAGALGVGLERLVL